MDEDLNESELEERMYAMLHYVDETQANVKATTGSDAVNIVENAPRSTIRRYWRTSGDHNPPPTQYQKINTPKEPPTTNSVNTAKPKQEKSESPTADLSIFQSAPQIIHKTIEILENDPFKPVLLESSDEDEVIEVALPPKPTITIESSDEDDICIITTTPLKDQEKEAPKTNVDRDSASPVPSVVSSVSDDFIRGDCIAMNISSRQADNHSFDFSLHGSDLLGQNTPSKKKTKKKSKDLKTSTPVAEKTINAEVCFATPKSKVKQKKQNSKSIVNKKFVIDGYDSDSNQCKNKVKQNSYIVSEKSLPSADVYDSDSNQSEIVKENVSSKVDVNKNDGSLESTISIESTLQISTPKTSKSLNNKNLNETTDSIVDLTDTDYVTLDETGITEKIVMANVTGFTESMDYGDEPEEAGTENSAKLGSTKIPPMLNENLDFDNLKGKDKVCRQRRYSLTSFHAEMDKFYNESWGGEDFNHREIQKHMSRDKNLWAIDPKDRMPAINRQRTTCHYCDRPGHRDDMCRFKPPVCYMCGTTGHYETRCPVKICVNCGSPNQTYTTMCRNCSSWPRISCAECGQHGHPATHCPDLWRRYHNTIDINMPLEENRQHKKHHQLYCSGCTRRGHLVHSCRVTIPFSGLPINSPYVSVYRPLHRPSRDSYARNTNDQEEGNAEQESINQPHETSQNSKYSRNKRQSKSPCLYETQKELKKKKQNASMDISETNQNNESIVSVNENSTRNADNDTTSASVDSEKAPDFIPLTTNNRDKKGHMIQDNEVSDTSDVVTSARIYITNDVLEKLKTAEGQDWLNKSTIKNNVNVQSSDVSSFLTIKGKVTDQESFQSEFCDWISTKSNNSDRHCNNEVGNDKQSCLKYIPKKRKLVLKVIGEALASLNDNLGEPKELYRRLTYLQKQRKVLLKQKVISPDRLSNSTDNIKQILKKLNMVLLGQAGLANGRKSVNKLHALQQKIIQLSDKFLPIELRKEIAQHYQYIFVAIERNDYCELLEKYNCINGTAKPRAKKSPNHKFESHQRESDGISNIISPRSPNHKQKPNVPEKTLQALISYRQKLGKANLTTKTLKKRCQDLCRRLHVYINCIFRNEHTNAKTAKKMKKVQLEAHQFLNLLANV